MKTKEKQRKKASNRTNRQLHEHHREVLKNRIILHYRAQMVPCQKEKKLNIHESHTAQWVCSELSRDLTADDVHHM